MRSAPARFRFFGVRRSTRAVRACAFPCVFACAGAVALALLPVSCFFSLAEVSTNKPVSDAGSVSDTGARPVDAGSDASGVCAEGTSTRDDGCSCTSGSCDVTCKSGTPCTFVCGSGATCSFRCNNANCNFTCAQGATCTFACTDGDCTFRCGTNTSCATTCRGGNCTTL